MKPYILIIIILLSTFVHSQTEDDSAFYLEITAKSKDGKRLGLPIDKLPEDLNLRTSKGILVVNGKVVEQKGNSLGLFNCEQQGRTCNGEQLLSGKYSGGDLELTYNSEVHHIFNGLPLYEHSTNPAKAGDIKTTDIIEISGKIVDGKFKGSGVYKDQENPEGVCVEWEDDDVGGVCDLEEYFPGDVENKKLVVTGWIRAPKDGFAVVSDYSGEVDLTSSKEEVLSLNIGTIVKSGYSLSTGIDSNVKIDFGYAVLDVPELTSLKIDEYVSKDNIAKTQISLNVGVVRARLRDSSSIRGDFSVSTPGALASIRGSEMIVSYDEKLKKTEVTVVQDEAFVTGREELKFKQGEKVTIDSSGVSTEKVWVKDSEESPIEIWKYSWIGVILIILLFVWIIKSKRTP
jgi:hypothetical protein